MQPGKKGIKDWEYKSEKKAPIISVELIKLEPNGKPPAPRCLHSAAQFSKKYLAIFGGRNDTHFAEYNNVALNDLCLYDISKFLLLLKLNCSQK